MNDVRLKLHPPQPREVVLRFNQSSECLYSGYETILKDNDRLRFYYRVLAEAKHDLDTEVTHVSESEDGIHWARPKLGIYEIHGSKENNVVLARNRSCHNLALVIDANPNYLPDQRYKALGGAGKPDLLAFASSDGLHWKQIRDEPVITQGAFDSQNNVFWSVSGKQHVFYFRILHQGVRWIACTTSEDFIHWNRSGQLTWT